MMKTRPVHWIAMILGGLYVLMSLLIVLEHVAQASGIYLLVSAILFLTAPLLLLVILAPRFCDNRYMLSI